MQIEMKVAGLTMDPDTEMPILLLQDDEERHSVPIWVGLLEAGNIATELEQVKLSRPTTHDLMMDVIEGLGAEVLRVSIAEFRDDTYFATVEIRRGDRILALDSRPSDAIALALRVGCSIHVEEQVIRDSACVELTPEQPPQPMGDTGDLLSHLPDEEFGKWKM